jgi:hypothetical protein
MLCGPPSKPGSRRRELLDSSAYPTRMFARLSHPMNRTDEGGQTFQVIQPVHLKRLKWKSCGRPQSRRCPIRGCSQNSCSFSPRLYFRSARAGAVHQIRSSREYLSVYATRTSEQAVSGMFHRMLSWRRGPHRDRPDATPSRSLGRGLPRQSVN